MSTVTGTIRTGITIGTSGSYASPLTIATTGVVASPGGPAIFGPPDQPWTIDNQGQVNGILLENGGFIANSGTIVGYARILAQTAGGASGTINNSGNITHAVYFDKAIGSVSNSGIIVGAVNRVTNLTNSGTVKGAGYAVSDAQQFLVAGTVTNEKSGLIAGGTAGISSGSEITAVTNNGTISGGSGVAILLQEVAGGEATVANTGSVQGNLDIEVSEQPGYVTNSGMIAAGASFGVDLTQGGTVANGAGGVIQGGNIAVLIGEYPGSGHFVNEGTVTNGGTIKGIAGGLLNAGIVFDVLNAYVNNSGTITGAGSFAGGSGVAVWLNYGGMLDNSGLIQGYALGISAGGRSAAYGTATIVNYGTITGFVSGVRLANGGSLRNSGAILGGLYTGASLAAVGTIDNYGTIFGGSSGSLGVGVALDPGGAITNAASGTIQGYAGIMLKGGGIDQSDPTVVANAQGGSIYGKRFGVYAGPASHATVTNSGTIGGGFAGILLLDGTQITNAAYGQILGNQIGIYRKVSDAQFTVDTTIINYGTIEGLTGILLNQGANTVVNYGAIIGFGGEAIVFFNGRGGRLIEAPGATISGTADGGYGATLELAAAASATGTLSGLGTGTSFVNFALVQVDLGATWQIDGSTSAQRFLNDGTIIVGGKMEFSSVIEDKGAQGEIDIGRTVAVFHKVDRAQTMVFTAVTGTIVLDSPSGFHAKIVGFGGQDAIEVHASVDGFVFSSGNLTLTAGGNLVATLHFEGSYTSASFALSLHGSNTAITFVAPKAPVPAAWGATASPLSLLPNAAANDLLAVGGSLA